MGGEREREIYRRMHIRDDAVINHRCHMGLFSSNNLMVGVASAQCLQLSRILLKSDVLSSLPGV